MVNRLPLCSVLVLAVTASMSCPQRANPPAPARPAAGPAKAGATPPAATAASPAPAIAATPLRKNSAPPAPEAAAAPPAAAKAVPAPTPPPAAAIDPARPDSRIEGYDPLPRGGEGGRLVEVTSLNDAGPGTVRAALADVNKKGGPARIVFRIGGTALVQSPLFLSASRVTIDGATAPAPGITLSGRDVMKYLFDENGFLRRPIPRVNRNRFRPGATRCTRGPLFLFTGGEDVIVRDVRFRGSPSHNIWVSGRSKNLLLDHVSSTECGDGCLYLNSGCSNITLQWCVFAGCDLAVRARGDRVSFHHCLFAENGMRSPFIRGDGVRDLRNNVIMNWHNSAIHTNTTPAETPRINLVNNFFSKKDRTDKTLDVRGKASIYAAGNVGPGDVNLNARANVEKPFAEPKVTTLSAAEAKDQVLRWAGARPQDEIDRGYAAGTRKGSVRLKNEWRRADPWWTKEKPPPTPTYDPYAGGGGEEVPEEAEEEE